MSSRFRDLEKPNPEHRKDIVLMAAVSGLESLSHPGSQDFIQFSALFPKLFECASQEARRTAVAALSRLETVPDTIIELIINQPVDVAAPFISHYKHLPETILARAIARHGVGHARAAARRFNLSPEGIAALSALNVPEVSRVLQLRGLEQLKERPGGDARAVAGNSSSSLPPLDTVHGTDSATDALRAQLRGMVVRGQPEENPNPANVRNKSSVHHMAELLEASRDFSFAPGPASMDAAVHLERLARFAASGDAHWFATALADAMNASFALAERIMLDLSGRQLGTTMAALGSDEWIIVTALETYFPHMAERGENATRANELVAALERESCRARLDSWLRADAYTNRRPQHVPVLAESIKPRGGSADASRGRTNSDPALRPAGNTARRSA